MAQPKSLLASTTLSDSNQPANAAYITGTRRWATIYLQLADTTQWQKEYFLLDTGAPRSFLWRPFARDLAGGRINTLTSPSKLDTIACNVEGTVINFTITDLDYPDPRLHGINLLGTDFLNEFVVIDDFTEGSCRLLGRYKSPAISKFDLSS